MDSELLDALEKIETVESENLLNDDRGTILFNSIK